MGALACWINGFFDQDHQLTMFFHGYVGQESYLQIFWGLYFKDLHLFPKVLTDKVGWRLLKHHSLWTRFVYQIN